MVAMRKMGQFIAEAIPNDARGDRQAAGYSALSFEVAFLAAQFHALRQMRQNRVCGDDSYSG